MNARYTYGGPIWGGGRRVDSGFDDVSAKRLSDTIPRLLKGGLVTILERGLILHVYFSRGVATIEYYPPGGAWPGLEGPISAERLSELFAIIEAGSDPTPFIAALPRIRPTRED